MTCRLGCKYFPDSAGNKEHCYADDGKNNDALHVFLRPVEKELGYCGGERFYTGATWILAAEMSSKLMVPPLIFTMH